MIRALMKKACLLLVFAVACGKEVPVSPSPPAPLPAQRDEGSVGVGDYGKAVDWMRSAHLFRFTITIGDVNATGDLRRARVGEERVRFKANGDEWIAERQKNGVHWTRNGKPEANEPAYADRIYQWITLFPDAAKSKPEIVGSENGLTHVRFTNLNTNETNDAWIRRDNHLARLKTSGAGSAFPAVEITIE
jgi:hypothetical protein